jgi:cytidine deaminase
VSESEVSPAIVDELATRARAARERAYAPYSRFRVGAALRDGDGRIFEGANVENASYGVTICAERVAAASAVAAGSRRIEAVAVVGGSSRPAAPCGACRQFLYEFGPEMLVVSESPEGDRRWWRLSELLIDGFGPQDLDAAT